MLSLVHRLSKAGLAAALVLSVLGGCSDSDDGTAGTATSPTSARSTGGGGGGDDAEAAEAAEIDPDDVIAKQTFKLRRNPENTVEVGIVSLVVTGKVATLRMVFTPRFASVAAGTTVDLYDIYEQEVFGAYLLDLPHLKRYDIVRSNSNELFASDTTTSESVNGSPMAVYAVFAAPEDGATAVDVHIADWWPAFKAVPVKR